MADALARQVTDVPFTGGLSTKLDPYQIPFNKLAAARDVVFTSPGQIQTRYGYKALTRNFTYPANGQSSQIQSGAALMSYGSELVMCDADSLYSWDAGSNRWTWKAPCTSMNVQIAPVIQNTAIQQAPDGSVAPNGTRLDAWEDSAGGVYYAVTDETTGQQVIPPKVIHAAACKPKVLCLDGIFCILYVRSDTTRIYLSTLPSANVYGSLTTVGVTSVATATTQLNATNPNYDATVIANTAQGPVLYVSFCNSVAAGNAGITTFAFSRAHLSSPFATATKASITPTLLTVFADTITTAPALAANGPVIAYYDGTDVKAFGYQYNLANDTFDVTDVDTQANVVALTGVSVSVNNSRSLDLYATISAAEPSNTSTWLAFITGATPIASSFGQLRRSVGLTGKAFAVEHDGVKVSYVPVVYQSITPTAPGFSGLQDTYFIVDSSDYIVARFLYGTAGGLLPTAGIGGSPLTPYGSPLLPEVAPSSATSYRIALTRADFLSTFSTTTPAPGTEVPTTAVFTQDGVVSVEFDFFQSQNSYLRAQLGRTLLIGGGLLQEYDGDTLVENGFSLTPENITNTQADTGNLTLLGTYWYTVVYQRVNRQGEITWSGPSIPFSVTLTGTHRKITLTIPTMRISKADDITIVVYRSTYIGGVVGTVFYQCLSTTVPADSGASNAPIINDRFSDTVDFVDVLADADLASRPQIYTTGNVIENLPTPPCSDLTVNYNRLFALSSTEDNVVYFSQQTLPGDPVNMSEWLYFNVDPRGGKATAIRALDQHLIVFKEGLIMAVDGIGPDATGGQGNFQDAYIVSTDVGCIYPRSIGLGPNGLYFQSEKGIAHLDRALQVTYIGWEAQALVNAYEVTSTQLMGYTQQMRFTLNSGVLVGHDYFVNQWFEHTNVAAVDSTIWNGKFAYLKENGIVMLENIPSATATIAEAMATYSDAGEFIGMDIESPWFSFGGLNGWARTWWAFMLGKVPSRCRIRVGIAYDQDPSVKQTIYIEAAPSSKYGTGTYGRGTYGGGFPDVVWRMQPNQQLANAIKLYVTVLQVDGVIGESISLSGFSFEWGQERTARRPNSSATYG